MNAIIATNLASSPIPGIEGTIRCRSYAQKRKLDQAERAAVCALLGCPVDSCCSTGELMSALRYAVMTVVMIEAVVKAFGEAV